MISPQAHFERATALHFAGLESAPAQVISLPPPVLEAVKSPTFPKLGGSLARALLPSSGLLTRDACGRWTLRAKWHLERIAEVLGEEEAARLARQLGLLVSTFDKKPQALRVSPGALSEKYNSREDLVALAQSLFGGPPVGEPGAFLPGMGKEKTRTGPTYDVVSGLPDRLAGAPFPARKIVWSARAGNPQARKYVAGLLKKARTGADPEALMAAKALTRAATLADRARFTAHYNALADARNVAQRNGR